MQGKNVYNNNLCDGDFISWFKNFQIVNMNGITRNICAQVHFTVVKVIYCCWKSSLTWLSVVINRSVGVGGKKNTFATNDISRHEKFNMKSTNWNTWPKCSHFQNIYGFQKNYVHTLFFLFIFFFSFGPLLPLLLLLLLMWLRLAWCWAASFFISFCAGS